MRIVTLDNRGLSPPEPMLRILAALERREPGETLEALLDRRPVFLFPELEERGVTYSCEPNALGGFTLRIEGDGT